jgi:glycosyltransferase involved in cell wall biosynthesis
MAALDVLALTSLWEGLPRVLPQAMAAGRPVVATAVDGSPEAVYDGRTGFLVKPSDVKGTALKITELLRDPSLRKRMGEEGKKHVGEFDIHKMVQNQQELYLKLIERKLSSS